MDYLNLSKIISLALRHTPEKYNILLDNSGWGDVNTLLISIAKHHSEYADVTYADLISAINSSVKKRHEINDQRIRALYGHTINSLIERINAVPPIFLYHGTNSNSLKKIKVQGLKKMTREYVHLSADIEQAKQVASRKTTKPVILKIRSMEAASTGIVFYKETDVWLCNFIPVEFIEMET